MARVNRAQDLKAFEGGETGDADPVAQTQFSPASDERLL